MAWATRNIVASPSAGASTCTPIGRPASPVPNGTDIAGMAGEVRGHGVHVGQVHRERIRRFSPSSNAGVGDVARDQHVELLVHAVEVAADERAHLLRLEVVGVVVAGRQRVGAEHDAPLHLGAEARVARRRVHVRDVVAVDAEAVAHAVVAREVRRRLGRRDQVVRRDGVRRRAAARPCRPGARRFEPRPRRRTASRTAGSSPSLGHLVGDADAQPGHTFVESGDDRGRRARDRGRVGGSWPAIASSSSAASATVAANGPI